MNSLLYYAPKVTYISDLTSDVTVENGESIYVWGFIISKSDTDAGTVEVQQATDSSVIASFALGPRFYKSVNIAFKADKGLKFSLASGTGSHMKVTVFHSQPGV
jgi:hypothetical protein